MNVAKIVWVDPVLETEKMYQNDWLHSALVIVAVLGLLACSVGSKDEGGINGYDPETSSPDAGEAQADASGDVAVDGLTQDGGPDVDPADVGPADVDPADVDPADVDPADVDPVDVGVEEVEPPCCTEDADCGDGLICVGADLPDGGDCWPPLSDGRCFTDDDCDPDQLCVGAGFCSCLEDCDGGPGTCEHMLPPGCCAGDEDCSDGFHCVDAPFGLEDEGVCKGPVEEGQCWDDDDCLGASLCQGASFCPCGVECGMIDHPGACVPAWEGCCFSATQCPDDDSVCVGGGPGGYPGSCKGPAPDGACWEDGDCAADEWCEGAMLCPCDALCDVEDEPGYCEAGLVDPCCLDDDDCGPGRACGGVYAGVEPGMCKDAPEGFGCFGDAHCPEGQVCVGENVCPCDANCLIADFPGMCVIPAEGECCEDDGDCLTGDVCRSHDGGLGVCKASPELGACWTDADCAAPGAGGPLCVGGALCPCEADCDGEDMLGECVPDGLPPGCCASDADCGAGASCLAEGVCAAAPAPGECFVDGDCYETQECVGATVCGCGVVCTAPTAPGACSPLPLGCCYTDDDCADGDVCRATSAEGGGLPGRCVPHPDGPQCMGDAACCWEDADCGLDGTCGGASVCGCIELCWVCGDCIPDQMGFCQ